MTITLKIALAFILVLLLSVAGQWKNMVGRLDPTVHYWEGKLVPEGTKRDKFGTPINITLTKDGYYKLISSGRQNYYVSGSVIVPLTKLSEHDLKKSCVECHPSFIGK